MVGPGHHAVHAVIQWPVTAKNLHRAVEEQPHVHVAGDFLLAGGIGGKE
jgi:hypothetical protein